MGENGNGNGNGRARAEWMPPWLSLLLEVIKQIGPVTAIALYLVYQLSGSNSADLKAMREDLATHIAAQKQLQVEFETWRADQGDFFVTLLALEQRICLNTANDGVERQACLNPEPKPIHHPGGGN